jgi:hypothetical protein
MGWQQQSADARRIRNWRLRRNRIVNRLLTNNPKMTTDEAIKIAHGTVGPMPKPPRERKPRRWQDVPQR